MSEGKHYQTARSNQAKYGAANPLRSVRRDQRTQRPRTPAGPLNPPLHQPSQEGPSSRQNTCTDVRSENWDNKTVLAHSLNDFQPPGVDVQAQLAAAQAAVDAEGGNGIRWDNISPPPPPPPSSYSPPTPPPPAKLLVPATTSLPGLTATITAAPPCLAAPRPLPFQTFPSPNITSFLGSTARTTPPSPSFTAPRASLCALRDPRTPLPYFPGDFRSLVASLPVAVDNNGDLVMSSNTPTQPKFTFNTSTTPAGNPPAFGNILGAPTSAPPPQSSQSTTAATSTTSLPSFGTASAGFNTGSTSGGSGRLFGNTSNVFQQPSTQSTTAAPASATGTTSAAPFGTAPGGAGALFGGSTSVFKQPHTQTTTAATAATNVTSLAPFATASTSGGAGALFGGSNSIFKQPSTQTKTAAPAATSTTSLAPFATASTSGSAGALFGGSTSTFKQPNTQTTTAAPAATSTTSSALFGAAPAASTTGSSPFGTTPVPSITGSTLFGAAPASSATGSTPFSTAPDASKTGAAPFGSTPAASTTNSAAFGRAPAASTTGPAPPQQSRLASKSMDEIITMWSTSLAQHQKSFQALAQQVSAWDRMLVESSTAISALYGRCFQAERDCAEVERQLSYVEHSQQEVEALLERYEGDVDNMLDQAGLGEGGMGASGVDAERERTYKAAEACSNRLSDMSHSLTDMIEEINAASATLSSATNGAQAGKDDPLSMIVRVLNVHLVQLQAIDAGASQMQARIAGAQRETRTLQQRQGLNGSPWVEDFWRSYLGRR